MTSRFRASLMAFAIAGIAALSAHEASAQALALAADRPGTTFNAIASGIAKVAAQHSGSNVIVRPYAGPAAWLPLLNSGEVQLGAVSASSTWQAFNGKGEITTPLQNIRILRSGSGSLMLGFIVRAKSDIRTLKDLRGKKVSSNFGGHVSISASLDAALRIGGMTWNDVTAVPVVGANDGIDALVAGRLDATWASLGQPQAREADVKVGIRYLPIDDTPAARAILREKVFPGAQIGVAKKGSVPGVEEDTTLLTYDSYLVAHKDLAPARVTAVLKALWDNTDDLMKTHRALEGFGQKVAVTDAPVAPYHPAAVAFYKGKGLWNDAAEKQQQELLKAAAGS